MAFEKTGHGISVEFSADSSLVLYLTSFTPPGFDAGDDIDLSTLSSRGALEYAPSDLGAPTDFSVVAAEDLADRAKLQALISVPQTITVKFNTINNRATGQKIEFAGAWVRGYTPGEHTRGEMPTVTVNFGLPGGVHTGDGTGLTPQGVLSNI